MAALLSLLFFFFLHNIWAIQSSTVVKSLPGFPHPLPFHLETGYVNVGNDVELFYYFIESENSPEDDPLFLWLTGGPGCSALSGLIYEIGPFTIDLQNSRVGNLPNLILNNYSWTKVANVIFLDQPVGTGFSYATTEQGYVSNDTLAVQQICSFLRQWLMTHFKFLSNRVYVGGDSYAGLIVPIVVHEISYGIDAGHHPRINLKGYMVGNPCTDEITDKNSKVFYAYKMGLISEDIYKSLKTSCNNEYVNVDPNNRLCIANLQNFTQCTDKIFVGHILEPICLDQDPKPQNTWSSSINDFIVLPGNRASSSSTPWCRHHNYVYIDYWTNDKTVQKALGIRQGTINDWIRCNKSLSYEKNIGSSVLYHKNLTNKSYQVLVYSGDHDFAIPYVGTQTWIKSLNLTVARGWQPWLVDGQIGGYTMVYSKNNYSLTFATVKGAGHTAPEYKPKECLAMVNRWFAEEPL